MTRMKRGVNPARPHEVMFSPAEIQEIDAAPKDQCQHVVEYYTLARNNLRLLGVDSYQMETCRLVYTLKCCGLDEGLIAHIFNVREKLEG